MDRNTKDACSHQLPKNNLMKNISKCALAVALTIAALSVFGAQHVNEDLWMALCSGRDTAHGLLARPDRWSFATEGMVWVDQGWLSSFIYYTAYSYWGNIGLVATKGMLLFLCVLVLFFKCRRLNVSFFWTTSALTLGLLGISFHLSLISENFALLYFLLLTSFLTMDSARGPLRFLACILVMLAWTNSHGSFVMGFVLIWVKVCALLVSYVGARKDRDKGREVWGWILTGFLSLIVMAFLNPYGPANLFMPFQQSESSVWTKDVLFWRPLLRITSHHTLSLYMGYKSVPFLMYVSLFAIAGIFTALIVGPRKLTALFRLRFETAREDLLTEILVCVSMLGLTVVYGRSLLFTGLAFVPITALTLETCLGALKDKIAHEADGTCDWLAPFLVSSVLLGGTAAFFYFQTLPPYLPDNPFFNQASSAQRLLGPFATNLDNLTRFLAKNNITGRMCPTWVMADVILWKVPDVQVFLDLRAQSIYPDALRTQYKSIFNVNPDSEASVHVALNLLDRYSVQAVVIDKFLEPTHLPRVLSASRKWVPVYHDPYAIVYVRTDSKLLAKLQKPNGSVWYPDAATEMSSLATLFLEGGIPISAEFEHRLRQVATQSPSPLLYRCLCLSERRGRKCFDSSTLSFLHSEYVRLGDLNVERPNGIAVLESRLLILSELFKDNERCPENAGSLDYRKLAASLTAARARLRHSYLPWTDW